MTHYIRLVESRRHTQLVREGGEWLESVVWGVLLGLTLTLPAIVHYFVSH